MTAKPSRRYTPPKPRMRVLSGFLVEGLVYIVPVDGPENCDLCRDHSRGPSPSIMIGRTEKAEGPGFAPPDPSGETPLEQESHHDCSPS